MRSSLLSVLVLCVAAVAQQAPARPIACDDPHNVDDYIAALKKRPRNKNPLPSDVCLFGGCIDTGVRPAEPKPPQPAPGTKDDIAHQVAFDDTIKAAKNVEVADGEFDSQNYRAALSRYLEAKDQKPGDAAIHWRLGRTYEKLGETPAAYAQYSAALQLHPAPKVKADSEASLARLKEQLAVQRIETTIGDKTTASDPCIAPQVSVAP